MSRVNIQKVKKPIIEPPSLYPDMQDSYKNSISQLTEKYGNEILSLVKEIDRGRKPFIFIIRQSIVDILEINYQSISCFMEYEYMRNYLLTKDEVENAIEYSASEAVLGAWCVGKEFNKTNPQLASNFLYKDAIEIHEIPTVELQLLKKAVYGPYIIFAHVFSEYYNSDYGRRMCFQKEGHFKDIYQGMMKGMIACFLEGLQS